MMSDLTAGLLSSFHQMTQQDLAQLTTCSFLKYYNLGDTISFWLSSYFIDYFFSAFLTASSSSYCPLNIYMPLSSVPASRCAPPSPGDLFLIHGFKYHLLIGDSQSISPALIILLNSRLLYLSIWYSMSSLKLIKTELLISHSKAPLLLISPAQKTTPQITQLHRSQT